MRNKCPKCNDQLLACATELHYYEVKLVDEDNYGIEYGEENTALTYQLDEWLWCENCYQKVALEDAV